MGGIAGPGLFTAEAFQALPSGCKLAQTRIQMELFPLASQAHNNSELELLLYSWAKLNVKSYKYLREGE